LPVTGALEGTTVLDLTEGVAGPYCTKLLAGYGAEVIKCERPGAGDPARRQGPFASGAPDGETGALHLYLNTAKLSVTLDVRAPGGQEVVRRLAAQADLLVTDCALELADAGLTWESLHAVNPRLAMLSLSAFGDSGPRAGWRSTNIIALAAGGQMFLTGDADREPLKSGGYQADYQLGLNGFGAACTAILDALMTGEGQYVEVSAQEAMASTLEAALNTYVYTGNNLFGQRRGNIMSALIGVYPAADGYIGIHAMPRNFHALLEVMEMPELADDPRFNSMQARLEHEDELQAVMYGWAATQNKRELFERAGTMRGPIAYVHDMKDLFESEHLKERQALVQVDHPLAGTQTYPRGPFLMSETPWRDGRAPLLGEHTLEVLSRAGLDESEIEAMRAEGLV
jgi:crotonobetainyl-CoA:carnitine CoA-transferase CaiB-like acyl-CoA transferase